MEQSSQRRNIEQYVDWSLKQYPDLGKMPSFVAQQHQQHVVQQVSTTAANPDQLKGKQLEDYTIVREHYMYTDHGQASLRLIVSVTAGTGRSYLIQCLKQLLENQLCVTARAGAYIVIGYTLHTLLTVQIRDELN